MSERTGVTKDARHLSGADIGRTATYLHAAAGTTSGRITRVDQRQHGTIVHLASGYLSWRWDLRRHDAVTITGADG